MRLTCILKRNSLRNCLVSSVEEALKSCTAGLKVDVMMLGVCALSMEAMLLRLKFTKVTTRAQLCRVTKFAVMKWKVMKSSVEVHPLGAQGAGN